MLKKKIFLLLLAVILIFAFTGCTNNIVNIPDPNLQLVIRDTLNKPTGNITTDDMLKLIKLDAGSKNISDLRGLEFVKNLTNLNLSSNKIKNIASLSNLIELIANEIGDFVSDKTVEVPYEGWYYLEVITTDGSCNYRFN